MSLSGKTALVTGATGFLGGALALRLAQSEGVQVRALARRTGRDAHLRAVANIQVVMGDVTDSVRMREIMQGCDLVFHAAAMFDGPLARQRTVNVQATHDLALQASDAGVTRFVHVSTIAVYGYRASGLITEDTPQRPGNAPYNVSKAEGEAALLADADRLGLPYSIVRPGMIMGPRGKQWTDTLFKVGRRNPVIFVGDGQGTTYTVDVQDVVDLLVVCATHPQAIKQAFNCVMWPHATWRDYLLGFNRLAGGKGRWFGLSPALMRPVGTLLDIPLRMRDTPQDLRDVVGFVAGDTRFSMAKAQDLLGWQPKIGIEAAIQRCEPYLREQGLLA